MLLIREDVILSIARAFSAGPEGMHETPQSREPRIDGHLAGFKSGIGLVEQMLVEKSLGVRAAVVADVEIDGLAL